MITAAKIHKSEVDRDDSSLTFWGECMFAGFKLVFTFDPESIKNGGTATWCWNESLSEINSPGGSIGSDMLVHAITDTAQKKMTIKRLEEVLPKEQSEPIIGFLVANELCGDWGGE